MYAPYHKLRIAPGWSIGSIPEPPIDPPEPTDEEYERNVQNSCREEAIAAIDTLASRLNELSDKHGNGFQNTLKDLEELQDYLKRDME